MDKRGILYAVAEQTVQPGLQPWLNLGIADLHLYDTKAIADKAGPLTPSKVIPLGGIVYHLYVSPDDNWLYYLDSHNRKIGRLDLKTATLDKENDQLEAGTNAMCMAPDGKKLYTCSTTNVVQVLDAASLRIEKTFKISSVKPIGIQATDNGYVFLNSDRLQQTNIFLVDTTKDPKAPVEAIAWTDVYYTYSIRLAPDQKRVYHYSPPNIWSYHIGDRPTFYKGQQAGSISLAGVNARGLMEISRDGTVMLCDRGVVLSLGR
jgi:WD40 repeat protein